MVGQPTSFGRLSFDDSAASCQLLWWSRNGASCTSLARENTLQKDILGTRDTGVRKRKTIYDRADREADGVAHSYDIFELVAP